MSASSRNTPVDEERLSAITTGPLPASRKVYVNGALHPVGAEFPCARSRRRPRRAHAATPGARRPRCPIPPSSFTTPPAPTPIPKRTSTCAQGLRRVRGEWVRAREDVEELATTSSAYGRARRADAKLNGLRFHLARKPLVAKAGRNVSQLPTRAAASSRPRWSSSPSARTSASKRRSPRSTPGSRGAPRSRASSRPSSCATKSRAGAPSSPPTSTTPSSSR